MRGCGGGSLTMPSSDLGRISQERGVITSLEDGPVQPTEQVHMERW